jgi:hypothetical protein
MPDSAVMNGSRLLRSRRLLLDLTGMAENPLPWVEADLLFNLMADVMGVTVVDAHITDRAQLDGLRDLWRDHKLARSLVVHPSMLGRREFAKLLRDSGDLCLVPTGPATELDEGALPRDSPPWRLRLDLGIGEAALLAWIGHAARGANHVEIFLGSGDQAPRARLRAVLSSVTSRLDEAQIGWCVHGVPHCIVARKERVFSLLQDGYCLYQPEPMFQSTIDSIIAMSAGRRRYELLRLIRRGSRYQRTLSQKAFNCVVKSVGLNSPAARLAQRLGYNAVKAFSLLRGESPAASHSDAPPLFACPEAACDSHHLGRCEPCSLRLICPGVSPICAALLDEAELVPAAGSPPTDPLHFLRVHEQTVPPIDVPRLPHQNPELAQHARSVVGDVTHGREIKSSSYKIQEVPFNKMNGSIQWLPAWERFCQSTVLDRRRRPLTVNATFFGKARYVGFSFGPSLQVMCPAVSDRHGVTAHVDVHGNYVLLRDGEEVEAVHVPLQVNRAGRLPEHLEPTLAAYGIDRSMVTQAVFLWDESETAVTRHGGGEEVDLSVVVVCTKYSRRLGLLARSIAGQVDFDLRRAELIVAYVPGLDGTEDILDCLSHLWPQLGTVGVPFDAAHMTHKGFMINQAVNHATGRRVLITDADIIMPPDLFHRLESEYRDRHFVAVEGRKMLDAKTTAELLMGLRDPVADFQYLRDQAPGERRIGEAKNTPIGHFQCVLRTHFPTVPYREHSHFEGADMQFSLDIRKAFGHETVMKDTLVLHLDHAGSRWYGTQRQF